MSDKKIAVIICTYNGEKYIETELDSILNQTRPADKLMIFDDRSKDNTVQVVKEWIKNKSMEDKAEIIVNEKNLGYRKNFENALLTAREYETIFFADQDDWWVPEKIEVTMKEFEKNPDTVLVFSNGWLADDNLDIDGSTLFGLFLRRKKLSILRKNPSRVLCYGSTITGCTMALKNSVVDLVVPFSETWVHDEWIGSIASCAGNVAAITTPLIKYRLHEGQQVGVPGQAKAFRSGRTVMEKLVYLFSDEAAEFQNEFTAKKISLLKEFSDYINSNAKFDREKAAQVNSCIEFLENRIRKTYKNIFWRFFFVLKHYLNSDYFLVNFSANSIVRDIFIRYSGAEKRRRLGKGQEQKVRR